MNCYHGTKFGKGKKKKSALARAKVELAYPVSHSKDEGKTHTRLYDTDTIDKRTGKAKDSLPVLVGSISELTPIRKEYRQRVVSNPNDKGWTF